MTNLSNLRDAAIKAFQDHETSTRQIAAGHERQRREHAQRQEEDIDIWNTSAFVAIHLGVTDANNDFAHRGSPFTFFQKPITHPGAVAYEIRRSGNLKPAALLTFDLHGDGLVHADTDERDTDLPNTVAVADVAATWAEKAAEQVMLAVLGGQRVRICMAQNERVVHVIDDDAAIRELLTFLLESAELEVRTYDTANAFLEALPHVHGCVVTDVRMPGVSGIELLRHLKMMGVVLPVIVITGHADVPLAVEAMKSGAIDFIEKPLADEAFLSTIRSALNRHERDSRREAARNEVDARLGALSSRERQVLVGLVAGCQNKTIAYDLGISPRTVEIYRANVMTKMQVTSLSGLVRIALVGGLLGPGSEPPNV